MSDIYITNLKLSDTWRDCPYHHYNNTTTTIIQSLQSLQLLQPFTRLLNSFCMVHSIHTGKVSKPATRFTQGSTIGCFKIGPIIGKARKNSTMVPKKSPKRNMIPMLSIIKPMNECLVKINAMPPKKKRVGLILVGLAKK